MRRMIFLACALALVGCGVEYVTAPCDDAGVEVASDAGASDAGSTDPVMTDVDACRLLEHATRHLDGCEADCPWPGIAGPGIVPQSCDVARVLSCVDAVAGVNACDTLADTVDAACKAADCR